MEAIQAVKEFEAGWNHFCKCIDFSHSALDAEAITFMNEAHAKLIQALRPHDFTEVLKWVGFRT